MGGQGRFVPPPPGSFNLPKETLIGYHTPYRIGVVFFLLTASKESEIAVSFIFLKQITVGAFKAPPSILQGTSKVLPRCLQD